MRILTQSDADYVKSIITELENRSLINAVRERFDKINKIVLKLNYNDCRAIQKLMCEVENLIEVKEGTYEE